MNTWQVKFAITLIMILLAASLPYLSFSSEEEPVPAAADNAGWVEVGPSSDAGGGISNTPTFSVDPFLAPYGDGVVVAWEEALNEVNSEIYLRYWTGTAWEELIEKQYTGSATPDGVNHSDQGYYPSMAVGPDGLPVIAWVEYEEAAKNYEVYLKRWTGTTWEELGGSASPGGISDTPGNAYSVSLAVGPNGNPMVAWEEYEQDSENYEVFFKRWTGSAWQGLGGSAPPGGIMETPYGSSSPSLAIGTDGLPVIAWEVYENPYYAEIYVMRWNGSSWQGLGDSASTGGISVTQFDHSNAPSLAIDPDNRPIVAWEENEFNDDDGIEYYEDEIYVRYWDGENWEQIGKSVFIGGVSNTSDYSVNPSLSIGTDGRPMVAWEEWLDSGFEIYAKHWTGTAWEGMSGSDTGGGLSNKGGDSYLPSIGIGPDGRPVVAWIQYEDGGFEIETYVRRWNGTAWDALGGATGDSGISNSPDDSFLPSVAFDAGGRPIVVWGDGLHDDYDGGWGYIFARRWDGSEWVEYLEEHPFPSASGGGVSQDSANSARPSVVELPQGELYLAWESLSAGNSEIYVKWWDGTAWSEIGGSATGGGISNNLGESARPSIAQAPSGPDSETRYPIVAWRNLTDGHNQIYVRRWDGVAWAAMGAGSATGGGISNTDGSAVTASIVVGADNRPIIVWSDSDSGNGEIYVKRWNGPAWAGTAWQAFSPGAASGGGISTNSGNSFRPAIVLDAGGFPVIAWEDNTIGNYEIYVLRWNGSTWVPLGPSASGGGISNSAVDSRWASLSIHPSGSIVVAWHEGTVPSRAIHARRWDGSSWVEMGVGSATGGGISAETGTTHYSQFPSLAFTTDGTAIAVWAHAGDDFESEIYARRNVLLSCHVLTFSHIGQGSDPVPLPAGSSGCEAGQYLAGESITLTAAPEDGWRVAGWTGTVNDASPSTSNTVIMPDEDHAVSVEYVPNSSTCFVLTRSHSGEGSDPVPLPASSSGCGAGQYLAGESITLTAAPQTGWQVAGWNGTVNDASLSTSNVAIMPENDHTVSVSYALYQAFMPQIIYDFQCFSGPLEREPNNNSNQAQSNGPFCDGVDMIQGLPNDDRDYFLVEIESAKRLLISVTNHFGEGVQLGLDYSPGCTQVTCFSRLTTDTEDSDGLQIDYPQANAGLYIIGIYTETPKPNETRVYTLQLTIE